MSEQPQEESLFEAPPLAEQERMVEAVLFASAEPVTIAELNARMPHGADARAAVDLLTKRYEGRGVRVVRVGEAWAIRTAPDLGFLPSLTTQGILGHNVRALLLAGLAGVVSLGILSVLMLMIPITLVAFLAGHVAWLGYSPLVFVGAFIVPHGLFEIPAAVVATAFALRIGVSVTAPREGLTVGEGLLQAVADFLKVFLTVVLPLLLIAAFVEANVTPRIVLWAFGG